MPQRRGMHRRPLYEVVKLSFTAGRSVTNAGFCEKVTSRAKVCSLCEATQAADAIGSLLKSSDSPCSVQILAARKLGQSILAADISQILGAQSTIETKVFQEWSHHINYIEKSIEGKKAMSDIVTSWQETLEHSDTAIDPDKPTTNLYRYISRILRDLAKGSAKDLGSPNFERLRNQAQRFGLWGNDVDAAQGALDVRLDGAEHLESVLLPILNGLGENLVTLACRLDADKQFEEGILCLQQLMTETQWTINQYRSEADKNLTQTEKAWAEYIPASILEELSSEGSDRSDDETWKEIEELLQDIETHISCLYSLESALEDPAESPAIEPSGLREIEKFDEEIIQSAAWPYIRMIMESYPSIESNLARRLGEANQLRFSRLVMERNTNSSFRVMNMPTPARDDDGEDAASVSQRSDYGAQDSPSIAESDYESNYTAPSTQVTSVFDDTRGRRNLGKRAESLTSITTSESLIDSKDSQRRHGGIPKMPDDRPWGEPFVCTVCGKLLSNVWGSAQWVKHVYQDLQPYVCSFSDCSFGLKTFTSRRGWADHEFKVHREKGRWYCIKCKKDLLTDFQYDVHRSQIHSEATALQLGRENAPSWISKETCPFCLTKPASTKAKFISHVGKHMRDISHAAIPGAAKSEYVEVEEVEDEEEVEGEHGEENETEGYNEPAHVVKQAQGWQHIRRQDVADPWFNRMRNDSGPLRSTAYLLKPFEG